VLKRKSLLHAASIAPILFSAPADKLVITSAMVRTNGAPIINLSNSTSYSYDFDLKVWIRVVMNPATGIFAGSEYTSHAPPPASAAAGMKEDLFMQCLEWEVMREHNMSLSEGSLRLLRHEQMSSFTKSNPKAQAIMSVSHLEVLTVCVCSLFQSLTSLYQHRLVSCVSLNLPSEYKQFLKMYANKLAREGMADKAEELCHDLLGPPLKYCHLYMVL
jgi:protein HIRA/HIR1